MLSLTLFRGYVKKLLDNGKVVRFLNTNYAEILGAGGGGSAMTNVECGTRSMVNGIAGR
jgi:hypothetical protein